MDASQIPDEHKVPTLFAVLTGRGKEAAQKIGSHSSHIDEFVHGLSRIPVTEHNIQQRKMNRWNAIKFSDFRAKITSEHEATSNCLEYLSAQLKALSVHVNNNATLLECIRSVFKDLTWCMTLYECTTANQDPHTFGQLLRTAASNIEHAKRSNHSITSSFPVDSDAISIPEMAASFFSKTRSLPHHPRIQRY